MAQEILNVSQLKVGVEDKEILHGVDLSLNKGETHVLMGPNGAGKSTLGYALMGNPRYEILGVRLHLTEKIYFLRMSLRDHRQVFSCHSRILLRFLVLHSVIL